MHNLGEDYDHEDLRAKVFGIPDPPTTIKDALTAASATEAEKNNQKLVVSLVEEAPKEETGQATEMTELEKIAKGVQDVLAISRQGRQGQASRATRNRGSSGGNFANYKCYNCNQMGHLRRQCPKPQTPFQSFGGARGGPPGRGFTTRRGRFWQNFGPSRARPFFGRPPGRSMMEIEAEEFWGGETNQFHPYETYPEYEHWSQHVTILFVPLQDSTVDLSL